MKKPPSKNRQRAEVIMKVRCGLMNASQAAAELGISEQTVANHKFQFLASLRNSVKKQELPEEIFPELYEEQ